MAANGHKCNDFVPPFSLKDLLDLFAKLAVPTTNGKPTECKCNDLPQATKAVLEELKSRLKGGDKKNGWIRDGPDPFCKDNANSGNGSASMSDTIAGLQALRNNILQNGTGKDNNPYTLPSNGTSDPCVKKYADAILSNAFPLFGCLFYLWFI